MSHINLKKFCHIFIPVMLFLLMVSITSYIERLLLARVSEEALAGSLNGFFLAKIFQAATLSVVIGGQAYVGLFHGADQPKQIGACIWQLIWFSLATAVVIPPIGFYVDHLLYHNTALAQSEGAYFSLLCWFNFLIPLGGALSAFYLGRGKALLIVFLTIVACLLNIGLDYLFIFGYEWVPAMGSMGAALGKVISQGVLCLMLGILFLHPKNREQFGSGEWSFEPRLFYHYIKPGFLRGIAAFPCLGDWALVTRTMSLLSQTHMLVFAIGSTIFYFFTFFSDALFQTTVTVTANHIGKKQTFEIWNSVLSSLAILGTFSLLLCVPFFLFPESLMVCFQTTSFFPEMASILQSILPWLWMSLIGYGLNLIALGIIIASRDTLFLFGYYCCLWGISFVPIYLTMAVFGWNADKFWLIVFFANAITAFVFFKRASKEKWRDQEWRPAPVFPEVS